MSSDGGTPTLLAEIGTSTTALEWTADGEILYAPDSGLSLLAVSERGGVPRPLMDQLKGAGVRSPIAVPGTDVVLFSQADSAAGRQRLYALSRISRQISPIEVDGVAPLGVLDGRLLYVSSKGDIMAAPFDLSARKVTDTPTRLMSGVFVFPGRIGIAYAALSHNGHLVYHDAVAQAQLVRADPQGRITLVRPDTQALAFPRYSPDEQRIAVGIADRETRRSGIWVLDQASGIFSVVADGSGEAERDRPEWSPDGKRLLYRRINSLGNQAAMRAVDRSDLESVVSVGTGGFNEILMLPGGRTLLARVNDAVDGVGSTRMYWWTPGDTTKTLLATPNAFNLTGPRPSPDGRWVAYSDETRGVRHVSIVPFPGPGPAVRVDQNGGGPPVWRRDGRGLLFAEGQGITEVTLAFTPNPVVTGTRRVIDGAFDLSQAVHAAFDVGRDGSLLLVRPIRQPSTIVVRDFAVEVRRRFAAP